MTLFDGVTHPLLTVTAGFGEALDPGAEYIHLGVGPGLGTGLVAGVVETDITADVRSIALSQMGRSNDIDQADAVTATIVLNNYTGDYDPTNAAGPYWAANLLTAEQEGLEGGTTTGWEVGGNCALASVTTQAHSGARSLRLTSSGAGGMWANTTTGTGGVRVAAGDLIRVTAWLRSATRSVTGSVCVLFWDASGAYLSQVNSAGTATSTSAWVQAQVTTTVPADAVYANAQVLFDAPIAGSEVHYADDVAVQGSGVTDGAPIRVRATWDNVAYDRFYGELAGVALSFDVDNTKIATLTCTDGLEKLARAYLPGTEPAMDGEATGTRIGLLANDAGYPSALRALDTGYTTLGRTTLGGPALELMQQVANTEYGLLYVAGSGVLTFYDRHHGATDSRSTAVQCSFAAGGAPLRQLEFARNRDRTFNRVALTRDPQPTEPVAGGGLEEGPDDEPVEQVANDLPSQQHHGILGFPGRAGQLLRNDSDVLALAEYLAFRYAGTQNHIPELRTTMLRGPRGDLLALRPLDRVEVTYDYGPNTISTQLHIQGVAEDIRISPASWDVVFSTTNPPPAPHLWIVGTSQVGVDTLGW